MINCLDISKLNIRYQENLNSEDTKENSRFRFLQIIILGFRTIGVHRVVKIVKSPIYMSMPGAHSVLHPCWLPLAPTTVKPKAA